nr:ribonuclease H-like domain-containing protein [Tanacetum cinerariifolium]
MRMEQYLTFTDHALWEVIVNGDLVSPIALASTSAEGHIPPKTAEQKLARKNELKAKSTLILAIHNEHLMKFHACKDAKSLWEAIKNRFGGNKESKKMHKTILKQNYKNFVASSQEGLDKTYDSTNETVNTTHSVFAASFKDQASSASYADDVMFSFFTNQSNAPRTKVKCYNCHRRGHFARECRAPRNQGNRNRDALRRNAPKDTSTINALVVQDGIDGYKCSFQAEEGFINFALMAYTSPSSSSSSSLESKVITKMIDYHLFNVVVEFHRGHNDLHKKNEVVYEEDIAFLKYDIQVKDIFIKDLKNQLENALKEKDDLKLKLEKFETSSKNLTNLINRQISDKDKTGLGYDGQMNESDLNDIYVNESEVLDNVFDNMFDSRESDGDDNQVNDRFKKGEGYHAVPHPYTGNYMPLRADLSFTGLDDYVFKSKGKISGPKEIRPVWDNTARVNHQSKLTHSHPKINFVLTAVLTKSGQVPVNAAKQSSHRAAISVSAARRVNTATTRPNVNDALPTTYSYFKTHSPGNPQYALQDQGIFDSGCSRHMTRNKSYLTDYQEINGGFVAFERNAKRGKITGKGKIRTEKLDFEDVYFVKELKFNLFSVSQMCDKKNSVLFTDTECVVLSPDFKLLDESQVLLKVPRNNNMYSFDLKNVVPLGGPTCLFAKATLDESNLWHRMLGHINFKTMSKLVRGNLVKGIENQMDHKVKTIRCDNRTKFKNRIMNELCEMKGIRREFSVARTPQQNSVAESKNQTLIEAARTMLVDSKLPTTFWAEAVNIACYVQNRMLFIKPHNKTPYELFLHRKPALSFMRPFGCHVTILNTLDHLGNQTNGNAGTKSNIDVGQARKKIVPSPQYILLPLLTSESQGPKSLEDEVADDADKKDLIRERAQRNELESMFGQDKDANGNNTYKMFTLVSAVGSSYVNLGGSIPDTGIFSGAYDDEVEGAVDNFNNLEPTTVFSPIPTTRIHKDNPKDQIIGDPLSAPQNRRMTKTSQEHVMVYRNKKDELGIVIRNKARLVAQGHTQEKGIDYDEVFALVARIEVIRVEGLMNKKFQISSMGELALFLGLQVMLRDVGIFISQDNFQVTPKVSHLYDVKRIFRYLKRQPKLGLWYPKDSPFDLEAFLDSDYTGVSLDRKSTTEDCQFLGKRPISWKCKKQTVVSNSKTKVAYVAAANCYGQVSDEAVYTREDDRVVRAATTTSLEAEQKSGNINKTRSMTTLNESSPQGTGSGSGPRCQNTTLGDADAQSRFETASKQSHDPRLSEVNTSGSGDDNIEHQDDLTEFVPPTPHDSPLSGCHTHKVMRGLDMENVSKQGRNLKTRPMFEEGDIDDNRDDINDMVDEAIENVKGDSVNVGGEVNTATTGVSTTSASATTAGVSISTAEPRTPLTTITTVFKDEDLTIAQTLIKMMRMLKKKDLLSDIWKNLLDQQKFVQLLILKIKAKALCKSLKSLQRIQEWLRFNWMKSW